MSFAWQTIAILLLLLPGFFFLVSMYASKHISRDVTAWKTPGQLAGIAAVSFTIHALAFVFFALVAWIFRSPEIGLPQVIAHIWSGYVGPPLSIDDRASYVSAISLFAILYVTSTTAVGGLAGLWVGAKILKDKRFRFLIKHDWAYDLMKEVLDGISIAYVLTKIRHEHKILLYKGGVKDFYVGPDGQISYLVLSKSQKNYLCLHEDGPSETDPEKWRSIEAPNNLLVIEGEDIANVIFTKGKMEQTKIGKEILEELLDHQQDLISFYKEIRARLKEEGNH